ncbi:MAG: hypothetical protein C5B52_06600 [Bacteroidetes bacterium]|nr:MAG: hypothetical protein C5B52_06600 [Bacteroidota bacterium]
MQLVVCADSTIKAEWLEKGYFSDMELIWIEDSNEFQEFPGADALFDLKDFTNVEHYPKNKLLFFNGVADTLNDFSRPRTIRINAWPGFLKRNIVEVVCDDTDESSMKNILDALGWQYLKTEDVPGMIAARVVSMIVNEAYFALGEGVSSREEIDIAMKLGTNYPWGPFEWAEKIGLNRIYSLLSKLAATDSRYEVAHALEEEVKNKKIETPQK